MADRFEAQSITRGSGLVADEHEFEQRNGRSVDVSLERRYKRPPKGDAEIQDAKRRVLNRLPRQEATLRRINRVAVAQARKVYKRADRDARANDGVLGVVEKSKYEGELTEIARSAVRNMRDATVGNMERATKTYLIAVKRSLKGKVDISMEQVQETAAQVARQVYAAPTGSNGMTTPQRLANLGSKLEDKLIRNLDKSERDLNTLYLETVDNKGSHRGCVSRNLARINRTEQNRAMHEATVTLARSVGVSMFYWRLSAAHKSYGGTEICEVLSESTGVDVPSNIPSGFRGSRRGLYTEASLPRLPHPNCMCSLEPLVL